MNNYPKKIGDPCNECRQPTTDYNGMPVCALCYEKSFNEGEPDAALEPRGCGTRLKVRAVCGRINVRGLSCGHSHCGRCYFQTFIMR